MTAAADLIRTLDSAFLEMSSLSASAARDAEDARRNAREASEVARRYTARSYAGFEQQSLKKATSSPKREPFPTHDDTNGGMNGTRGIDEDHDTPISQQPLPPGGRKRKIHADKVQSSSERLARSHAEDVLSLSLELERTKQALDHERMAHDETRSTLSEARAKNTQLETQIEKLLNDAETQREDCGRQMDGLQQELNRAQVRVEAAEEDAQLALDLAKGNAESREQLETWLQRALQEVEVLRNQLERVGAYGTALLAASPEYGAPVVKRKPVVRFAETPTVVEMPAENNDELSFSPRRQASRSMVAAGRQLLHRATTANDEKVHAISLTPEKSAERREKLRRRLRDLDSDVDIATPASVRSSYGGSEVGSATKAMENCSNVARLLRESGQRLGLDTCQKRLDDSHVESVARNFCQTVEVSRECGILCCLLLVCLSCITLSSTNLHIYVATLFTNDQTQSKLNKQKDDIQELQALCVYLENKLVVSDDALAVSCPPTASFEQSP